MEISINITATKHTERRNGDKTDGYYHIDEELPKNAISTGYACEYFIDGIRRYCIYTHWWKIDVPINMQNMFRKGGIFTITIDSSNLGEYGHIKPKHITSIKSSSKKSTYRIL